MRLYFKGHDYKYAAEQMLLTLFPGEKPVYEGKDPHTLHLSLHRGTRWITAFARLTWQGKTCRAFARTAAHRLTGNEVEDDRLYRQTLKLAFYRAGCTALGQEPPWGSLTGVRPVKLPTKAMLAGKRAEEAERELIQTYQVTPRRARLAVRCAQKSVETLSRLGADDVSLYVGIPFCPSRCAYCSFVSADVGKCLPLLEPFLTGLEKELAAVGRGLRAAGKTVRTVYIGGGTPTTLSAHQLESLLSAMETHLDLSRCEEFTVEAGRPDTITPEKLAILAKSRVGRVSVNPQTMEDAVLAAMGRKHRSEDVRRAYTQVREAGDLAVNMDLIAGLPGDSVAGFERTLQEVLSMAPENITVHTLALKKGAALMENREALPTPEEVAAMLELAWSALEDAGYTPYYLYRQKYMSGGFENIGWCLPGEESRYNIIMMEELHSVVALGGGGITKLIHYEKGRLTRLPNPKYPREYIERVETLCEEKEALPWHTS